ncbi:MAG: phosphoribosylanthranilate isomerase, partial [Blautia sp.]|nr:phosphoribosylanthranilate isomerase [Blautia sp.]
NGGTGQTFDWSLVENVDRPFFLAGGLGISNLEKAIERLSPWAVDLSSSLETEGKKDPEKIKAAVKLVRRIEAQVERT